MTFPEKISFTFRRFAEISSRRIYFTRHLPKRFDSMRLRISPSASLKYWRGLGLPQLNDLYDFAEYYVKPGATVWDIGANMGVFAFPAAFKAQKSGRVLCLEPDIWSVRLLKQSCIYNRDLGAQVDVLPVAISDSLSLEWLNIPDRSRAATHLEKSGGAGKDLIGNTRERHLVPTVTLDWLASCYSQPQVIKIDVDGGEFRVLKGGRALFEAYRPVILVEVYERNADAVSIFLQELGYILYDYNYGEAGKCKISRAVYNTLALPS